MYNTNNNNVISMIKAKADSALSLARHNKTEVDRIKDSIARIDALLKELKSYTESNNNKDPNSQVEL